MLVLIFSEAPPGRDGEDFFMYVSAGTYDVTCTVVSSDTLSDKTPNLMKNLINGYDNAELTAEDPAIYLGILDIPGDVPLTDTLKFIKTYLLLNPDLEIRWY